MLRQTSYCNPIYRTPAIDVPGKSIAFCAPQSPIGAQLLSCSPRSNLPCLHLRRRCISLFVAGTETTALSLCWAMYYLSKNPEAVLRCRAEALKAAPLRYVQQHLFAASASRSCFHGRWRSWGVVEAACLVASPPAITQLRFNDAGWAVQQ